MTVLSIRWRQESSWNSPFESNQASLHRWLHTYPSSKTQVLHLLQTTADSSTWPGSFASSLQEGTCHWQTQTQGSSQDAKRSHVQITATLPGHWTSCDVLAEEPQKNKTSPILPPRQGWHRHHHHKCYAHYLSWLCFNPAQNQPPLGPKTACAHCLVSQNLPSAGTVGRSTSAAPS